MSATPTSTQAKIDAAIDAAAEKPTFVAGEFGSVTNRAIDQLITLDRYNQGKKAASNGRTGITVRRFKAGGAHS